jgi:hypothetical protein
VRTLASKAHRRAYAPIQADLSGLRDDTPGRATALDKLTALFPEEELCYPQRAQTPFARGRNRVSAYKCNLAYELKCPFSAEMVVGPDGVTVLEHGQHDHLSHESCLKRGLTWELRYEIRQGRFLETKLVPSKVINELEGEGHLGRVLTKEEKTKVRAYLKS